MENPTEDTLVPDNFRSIIVDFVNDLSITFPEYSYLWNKWAAPDLPNEMLRTLFDYILSVMPERFFDILYQNEDIFNENSGLNTMFLPDVDFKMLFQCAGVSEATHKTMWKYLQLILFSIINSVKSKTTFGDTMNMFNGMDDSELQSKLSETMSGLTDFFNNMGSKMEENGEPKKSDPEFFENMPNMENFKKTFDFAEKMGGMPNPEELHSHLKGLFDGKIGKLAKEMAEELTGDITGLMGDDDGSIRSTQDVIQKLMKDPKKMMNLVKTIGSKLDSKMKNGDISQEEMMKEASELFSKMKNMDGAGGDIFKNLAKQMRSGMGGMGNMENLANLASTMSGMGKNTRIDNNAMNNHMKKQTMREKLKERLDKKREMEAMTAAAAVAANTKHAAPEQQVAEKNVDDIMKEFGLTDEDPGIQKKSSNKKKKGKK